MTKYFLSLLCVFNFSMAAQTPSLVEQKAQAVDAFNANIQSLTIEALHQQKYLSDEDTTQHAYFGQFQWVNDTLTLYNTYNKYHNYQVLYTGEAALVTNFKDSTAMHYPKDYAYYHDDSNIFPKSIFKRNYFTKALRDTTIEKVEFIEEATIHGIDCFGFSVRWKDDADFYNNYKETYFSQSDTTIVHEIFKVDFDGMHQYVQVDYFNVAINPRLSKQTFDVKYTPSHIKKETYAPSPPVELFEVGTALPELKILAPEGGDSIAVSDYKGKLVLLDFWYISCYPCIKAMPIIQQIKQDYKDKVVVLALNMMDTPAEIKAYEQKKGFHNINYTITRDDFYRMNVTGAPSFYLLDEKGRVQYARVGYNEALGDDLRAAIDAIIDK